MNLTLVLVIALQAPPADVSPELPYRDLEALPDVVVEVKPKVVAPEVKTPEVKPAIKGPRLLVLDLKDGGAGPLLTKALSQVVQSQAPKSYPAAVVTAQQLRAATEAAANAAVLGCVSADCAVDVAKQMEADQVLAGDVTLAGDDVLISLVLVDARDGARLKSIERKVPRYEDLSYYAARQLTALALTGKSIDTRVPVRIVAKGDGLEGPAKVVFDGKEIGDAPVIVETDPGDHEVQILHEGFAKWRAQVTVDEGTPVSLTAELVKDGVTLWPATTISAVVALLAAGGGVTLALVAQDTYDGSLGIFGDRASSYEGLAPASSSELAARRQQVQQFAVGADALFAVAGVATLATLGFLIADIALE